MTIVVHQPGLLTTLQDLGRWGHQSAGVPVAGPMDGWSHRLANLVLGNAANAAVLEVTVTGPVFECDTETEIAITGAPFGVRIGRDEVQSPLVVAAAPGTAIRFGECFAGTRAYVAVAGGFDVPLVLGSRSTDLRGGFGGCAGRAVRAGDRLAFGQPGHGNETIAGKWRRHAPSAVRPLVRELREAALAPERHVVTRLRVMRGPSEGPAADRAFSELLAGVFRISPRSDRMGYRLEAHAVAAHVTGSMITGPTTMGLVQVPPSGEPILLMADRQTTGGYAAVAVVIAADLPLAGQLGPGHTVAFDPCTYDEARRAFADRETQLTALEAAL
jgi:antagonist of KipI